MSTGLELKKLSVVLVLGVAVLCTGGVVEARADSVQSQSHHKTKTKKAQLPPLPSGPTGRPVQQVPLDSIAAVPPQVSYQDSQLTIVAPNSTLGDILRAVRKQTGAEIEVPAAPERVVTHLGPGPARDVLADLLNGSRFNYVLLGSPGNDAVLTRVVLVPKAGSDTGNPNPASPDAPPGTTQAANGQPADQDQQADANDAEANDDNGTDDNADSQPAEAEQQPPANPNPDQPGVKTPQQMLQEMQQRQLMIQQGQQQQAGQPPVPGTVPHPPQEQQ
jgi:hypothetical protein